MFGQKKEEVLVKANEVSRISLRLQSIEVLHKIMNFT